ncbi:hypothetical protein ACQQ2N_00405 [Dokdonella sp. MW10]|uniref:hypothetical protein n=1 Tax=Dokdonella sp. MW10 TaxID=2992926 RepID=UPI003F80E946
MNRAHDEADIGITFVIGLFASAGTLSVLVLRMILMSAFGKKECARKLVPARVLVLADLFAFRAALFALGHPKMDFRVRFFAISHAVMLLATMAAWIWFLAGLLMVFQ